MDYFQWGRTPDASKRVRRLDHALLFSVTTHDERLIHLAGERVGTWPEGCFAKILREGPLFDVHSAGTDLVVSSRVRALLERELDDAVQLLPITVRGASGMTPGYFLLNCTRSHKVLDFVTPNVKAISAVSDRLFLGVSDGKVPFRRLIARQDLVEKLVGAGFTGLGFTNLTGRATPATALRPPPEFAVPGAVPGTPDEFEWILQGLKVPSENVWGALIERVEARHPGISFAPAQKLDLRRDVQLVRRWLEGISSSFEYDDLKPTALWFGLSETADAHLLTLCCSAEFDPTEPFTNEWAVDHDWSPSSEVELGTGPIKSLRDSATTKDLRKDADYLLPLGYALVVVAEALAEPTLRSRLLNQLPSVWITVGWNEGDFVAIGPLTATGLRVA